MKNFLLRILANPNYIAAIWLLMALAAAIKQYSIEKYNNYLIFKNVFWHTIQQEPLYQAYPELYFDHNHYGVLFSCIIAPFALLPDLLGIGLWNVLNAFFLIAAVYALPLSSGKKSLILWLSAHELLTTALNVQFNPSVAAMLILAFVFIDRQKDVWAALMILIGTFVKLYGIVGLAFFFFSKQKTKLIAALLGWSLVLFVLPMVLSSPTFVWESYGNWYERLLVKNSANAQSTAQDISLMGMVRRIVQQPQLSNLPFLVAGALLFALPYLRWDLFEQRAFRLRMLASVLIFVVIFSTGSESPTYIIAFMGVSIWFALQEKPTIWHWFLLIFAVLLTSFSPSDLFPRFVREGYIKPYALKALPCVLVWLQLVYEMLRMPKEERMGIE